MPRKKPKTQTKEEREKNLAIKRDKMKLLCEQIKLQSNNEELTFEEDQEPPVQRNKEEELERQRKNEIVTLKKTIELWSYTIF